MNQIEQFSRNLEFTTTLCRIQNKSDPLQIFVEGSPEMDSQFPELPSLAVTIKNLDSENRGIGFQQSGDYRSGRQARWRIEVRDTAGSVQSFKMLRGMIFAGGLTNFITLKPGEGWETALNMASFVETLEPGEYQIRVLYHNDLEIVDREFVAGLVVCQSEPIKFTVKRRSIQISPQQQQDVFKLLQEFDDRQPCKIIDGKYGEWAHKFIAPDSQYGRLLKLDWTAVPALVDELDREGQSHQRKAHLIALLFSITGENSPQSEDVFGIGNSSVLGTYSVLSRGWSIWSKSTGEEGLSGGFRLGSGPTTYNAKCDAEAQTRYIKQWQKMKPHYEVISIE